MRNHGVRGGGVESRLQRMENRVWAHKCLRHHDVKEDQ